MKTLKHLALALSVSCLSIASVGYALADSPNLKGSYGFTGTAACLIAPGSSPNNAPPSPGNTTPFANAGFNSRLQTILGAQSFSHSFSVEGIRTFNGDGTGTVKGTSVGIAPRPTPGPGPTYPAFPPDAGSDTFSFNFTYIVSGDGSWTAAMVPGSYHATHLMGPRTGQTSTIDVIPPIGGLISRNGDTLIGAHLTTAVETVTFSNGDVWPMICHRSRVFIRVQDQDSDGHHDDDHHDNDHH
jgi:hypothetical protein